MKKLRMAVIGCGGISYGTYLPGYLKMENVDMIKILEAIYKSAETGREVVL